MLSNTLAHLGGRSFSAIVGFVVTTLVATQLGAAAMGVFGIYMVLQSLMGIFEGGMSTSINRAIATDNPKAQPQADALRLFRTYEMAALGLAIIIGLFTSLSLPWIVSQWESESAKNLSSASLAIFAGLALASRFLQTLYQHVLFGAQHHKSANSIIGLFAGFRAVGLLLVLLVFKMDLKAVFVILALSNGLEVLAFLATCRAQELWYRQTKPSFQLLKKTVSFMAPISGATIIALLLSQADRIIIGQLVSLEQFGLYSLVASYAFGINALAYAPGNVFYPTITGALHNKDMNAATEAVTHTLNLILTITFPVCLWAFFYGTDIGAIIFRDAATASMTIPLWKPLFLACCFNVLTIIPFKIFLAQNRPDIIFKINLMLLFLYPFGFAGGIHVFGYEKGLFALPVLAGISFVSFLLCLRHRGEAEKLFAQKIMLKSAGLFALLFLFYASARYFITAAPDGLIEQILLAGWPLALAGATTGWFLVLWHIKR